MKYWKIFDDMLSLFDSWLTFQAWRCHTISKVGLSSLYWVSTKSKRPSAQRWLSSYTSPQKLSKFTSLSVLSHFNMGAIWNWPHEFKATKTPQMLPIDARTSGPRQSWQWGRGGGLLCFAVFLFSMNASLIDWVILFNPDCTQVPKQHPVLCCKLCPRLRWTAW